MEHLNVADCINNNEDNIVCLNGTKSCSFQINTYLTKNYYFDIKCLVENTLFNKVFLHENECSYSEIKVEENNNFDALNVDEILNTNTNDNFVIEEVDSDIDVKPHELLPISTFNEKQDEITLEDPPKRFRFDEQHDVVVNDIFLKREADDPNALPINTKKFKFDTDENDDTLKKSNEANEKQLFNENVAYVPIIPLDIDEDKAKTTNLKYLNLENNCTEVRENTDSDKIQMQTPEIPKQHSETPKTENTVIKQQLETLYRQIKPTIVCNVPADDKKKKDNLNDREAFDLVKRQWSTETPVNPVANLHVRFTKNNYSNIKSLEKIRGGQNQTCSVLDVYVEHLNYLQETLNSIRKECQNLKDVHFRSKHFTNKRFRHVDARIQYLQQQKGVFHDNITKMKTLIEEVKTFYAFYENQQITEYEREESNFVVESLKDFDEFYGYFV